jgi:hypothetical protein
MTEQRMRTVWRDAGVVHSTGSVTLDGDQIELIAEKEYGCAMLRRRKT